VVPNYDKAGREVATVIVKGSFRISGPSSPTPLDPEEQVQITMADEYRGEPGESPIKLESDLAVFKLSTDIIMIGFAYDPRGRSTKKTEVGLRVGSKRKVVNVTSAEPMERIPLWFVEYVPSGPKWSISKTLKDGFGFYPKNLSPRVKYAGTYDQRWEKERKPFLPEDFDYRFFQSAFPDLICDGYLKGNESIAAVNVTRKGPIQTRLPGVVIQVEGVFKERRKREKSNLDTVILDPEEKRVVLVWRWTVAINGPPSRVEGFRIQSTPVFA
jgi:hypothetical protein